MFSIGHGECEGRLCEGLQGGFVVDLVADLEEVHRHLAGLVHLAPGSSLHLTVGGTECNSFGAEPTMHVVLAPS